MKKTVADAWSKVRAEQAGGYPGGVARAAERRRILTRTMRPVTLGCLQQGLRQEAWKLFRATFAWNASLGRFKYLTAFPVFATLSLFRARAVPGAELAGRQQKSNAPDS
jgi:hypothetical protein